MRIKRRDSFSDTPNDAFAANWMRH